MALIVTIFLLVLLTQVVSWIGKSVLQEFVCNFIDGILKLVMLNYCDQFCAIYLRVFHSQLRNRQRELKSTVLSTKADLLATSAQDQFAKWAKLRRSVDKGLQDLEKTSA
jgi:hypothetical protein